ncbi:MAG: YIP1 family protein [Chloroflexi bacterium]|nr:YIP1 family protein [Chloroflexota bacterium]
MPIDRMIRAIKLDARVFDEVKADPSATTQAFIVVLAVALAQAIATLIGGLLLGAAVGAIGGAAGVPGAGGTAAVVAGGGVVGALISIVMVLVWWVVLSFLAQLIGTKLLGGTGTLQEVLRAMGFAHSPQVLDILSFIPLLGGLLALATMIWRLVISVIALRQTLSLDTTKAVILVVILVVIFFVVGAILAAIGLAGAIATSAVTS